MNADKFVVRGQTYDVLSPATFGDYIETVGAACINPNGYAENKLFLAYDDNVQKLFRATAAIAYSDLLIKETNCEPTTMAEALANALSAGGVSYDNSDSGLTASNVQGAIDEVNGDVETVKSDLSNKDAKIWDEINNNGSVNLLPINASTQVNNGATFIVNKDGTVSVHTSGVALTSTAAIFLETAVVDIPDINKPIKFTCCPVGASGTTYEGQLNLYTDNGTLLAAAVEHGNGTLFDYSAATRGRASITLFSGMNIPESSPIIFKPMISLASLNLSYNDHVPYAKTNRDLTENLGLKTLMGTNDTTSTNTNQFLKRCEITFTTGNTKELIVVYAELNNSNAAALRIGLRNAFFAEKNNPDKANPWTYYPQASTICWSQIIERNTTKTIELWGQWSANANNCIAYLQVSRIAV